MQTLSRSTGFVLLLIVTAWLANVADAQEPPELTEFDEPDIYAPYRERVRKVVANKDIAAAEKLLLEMPDVHLLEAVESGDTLLVALVSLGNVNRLDDPYSPSLYQRAAERHDLDMVRTLLRSGLPLPMDDNGFLWAARHGHMRLLKLYIEEGMPIDLNNRYGDFVGSYGHGTALHEALEHGQAAVVDLLLKSGADVKVATETGWTPLHAVARSGRIDLAEKLLLRGADLNVKTVSGASPVHDAIEHHHPELARWMLKHGATYDAHIAAGLGDLDALRKLYPDPLKLDPEMMTSPSPIFLAAKADQLSVVKYFIEAGLDVNLKDKEHITLLNHAAGCDAVEVTAYLLSKNANPHVPVEDGSDRCRYSPLHHAAASGSLKTMQLLLDFGLEVDYTITGGGAFTPLAAAIYTGQPEAVKLLLAKGARLEGIKGGSSPVNSAIYHRQPEICRILLNAGASPDFSPKELDQNSAAHLDKAVEVGDQELFEMLLEYGAKAQPIPGKATLAGPLYDAKVTMVRRLIDLGMDVNGMNFHHRSLLAESVQSGRVGLARRLLQAGARIKPEDDGHLEIYAGKLGDVFVMQELQKQGFKLREAQPGEEHASEFHTALEAAVDRDRKDMVRYLISQGLNPRAKVTGRHGSSLLELGARRGSKLAVLELLAAGAAEPPFAPAEGTDLPSNPLVAALVTATSKNHFDLFRTLYLREDWRDDESMKTVWRAAGKNRLALDFLIQQRPLDPRNLEAALRGSVESESLYLVELLLLAGAPADLRNGASTMLHDLAAIVMKHSQGSAKQRQVALLMVEKGARLDVRDANGWTPAHAAARKGNVDLARALIERGNPLDAHLAAAVGNVDYLKQRYALHGADFVNQEEPAKDSVVSRVVRNETEATAEVIPATGVLAWAAIGDSAEAINYLVSLKFLDLNESKGMAPLLVAIEGRKMEAVKALLSAGADPNGNDRFPKSLLMSLDTSDEKLLQLLLDHKASPQQTDLKGRSVLFNAVQLGQLRFVKLLVQAGAPLDETFKGSTLLELALKQKEAKSREIGHYLLEAGADPHAGRGEALYWEVYHGEIKLVEQLLKRGLNPNRQTAAGSLALHGAVHRYLNKDPRDKVALEMIRLLFAYGADPEVPDKNLHTAIGYAEQQQCTELLPLLRGGIKPR